MTIFMEAMNRDPRIADVYRIHLDLAKSKGLWTHNPYTDTSQWSRFGQWGHLELLEQAPADSPKYSLMLEHFSLFSTLKHIDAAVGAVPSFSTDATLPTGIAGTGYTTTIQTAGGNGSRSVVVVGALLDAGLTITSPSADTLTISGTPITSRKNFILARVQDADGDPAWRTFTLQTFGGPGTLIQSNFQGAFDAATELPFTTTFVLDSGEVSWGGWGVTDSFATSTVTPENGTNGLVFSVAAPSDANSTLAGAKTDNEFLTARVTPASPPLDLRGGEIRFSTRRIEFHAPLGYALFTSLDGFTTPLYVSDQVSKDNFDDTEHIVTVPSTATFNGIAAAFNIRIYAFGAQFTGHATSLSGFKLTSKNALTLTSLSSNKGPTAGGQSVIIGGANLSGATSVTFGGTGATIVNNTATAITVTTPPRAAATVSVAVTTPAGSLTLPASYTFVAAPTIGSILPASGPSAGAQSVTISGTNLSGAASVTFGGSPAPMTANTASSIVVATPAHAVGAVNVVVTTAGGSVTSAGGYTYNAPAPPAPTGLVAAAFSASQIDLVWNAVSGATSYQVDRKAPGGAFTQIATPATNSFSDTGRPANTSFLYRVRAVNGAGASADSNIDLATSVIFTDRPLVAGTDVKAIHLSQLRTAVNAVRALAGLGAFSFTGSGAVGTAISATHVTELRTALDAARQPLGLSTGGYTDPSLTGVAVKAVHFQEARNRVE